MAEAMWSNGGKQRRRQGVNEVGVMGKSVKPYLDVTRKVRINGDRINGL